MARTSSLVMNKNYIYLARRTVDFPTISAGYLDSASAELRSVGEITSRSLGFVRKDLAAKDIDLVELANVALELHRGKISTKRINVAVRMDDSVVINGKRGELLQVLVNLLLNATEALPHSGNLQIRVMARRTEAVVTIADNGSGIPDAFRSSLFQSFKSNKESGSGLGLWVAKQIVEGHQGRIRYRSSTRVGKSGTVFRIALPTRKL
jgi:signal transduction histidine kinase